MINKNLLINLLLLRLFPINVFRVCMVVWSFIKSACFLSYLLVSLFRLIFSSTILDHIPWRGKGGVFHHSCVSPRTQRPMGIPQCHLLRGTRTTECSRAFPRHLTFLTSSKASFASVQIPAQFVAMPVSLALFCAVFVVTALRSLFPTLILPSVLLFFYAGVVKPC